MERMGRVWIWGMIDVLNSTLTGELQYFPGLALDYIQF